MQVNAPGILADEAGLNFVNVTAATERTNTLIFILFGNFSLYCFLAEGLILLKIIDLVALCISN